MFIKIQTQNCFPFKSSREYFIKIESTQHRQTIQLTCLAFILIVCCMQHCVQLYTNIEKYSKKKLIEEEIALKTFVNKLRTLHLLPSELRVERHSVLLKAKKFSELLVKMFAHIVE